jgi:hypothetical protein
MGYHTERYSTSVIVLIKFESKLGNWEIIDECKGLNTGHAYWRAHWNWDSASEITLLHSYQV